MHNFMALCAFILYKRGAYKFELKPSLHLEKDLKITGDDAYEFMDSYASEFNVNIDSLYIPDYFATEASWSMYKLVLLSRSTGKKVITIEDLYNGMLTGILDL